MEKSIEKIWSNAFINESDLLTPKLNDLYNQKSKSIINKIKRTYEIDNKGLIPIAGVVIIGGIFLSEIIIGIYGGFLILALYVFNTNLLKKFNTIDVKLDNLTYLKNYRNVMNQVINSTKRMFVFVLPLAVLSIFILAYFMKDTSFLFKLLNDNTSFIEILTIGFCLAVAIAVICYFAFSISNKILYGAQLKKLDVIIDEIETLQV